MNKQMKNMIYELLMAIVGVSYILVSSVIPFPEIGFVCFVTGAWLAVMGLLLLGISIHNSDLLRKRIMSLRIVKDQHGIILTIIAMVVGIGLVALIWFPLSWACYLVIDICTSQFNYPPVARNIISQCVTLIAWMLVMCVGLFVLWGFASSLRRQEIGEPVYR